MNLDYGASGTTVVPASGTATITLPGPSTNLQRRLSNIVISCTAPAPRPTCKVYRSIISPFTLMATSQLGYDDTFVADPNDRPLKTGENLVIVWTGALAGATVTVNANGYDYN